MLRSKYPIGKALAALLAVFALGAASASAATPEFVPKPGETFPISIGSSLHTGSVAFDWTGMNWGTCSEIATAGTITSAKAVSLTLEWAGCSSGWHSEGSPEGHIVITGTGTLTYIARSSTQVGIVVALKEVTLRTSSNVSIKLRGSLVIPITPLNTEASTFALPIHETSYPSGEPEFTSYENESREVIDARPQIEFGTNFKKAGFELLGANELTTNKPLTVKAPPPPLPEFVLGEGGSYPVALESSAPTAKASIKAAAGIISCEGVSTKGTIAGSTTVSLLTYELQHCKKGEGSTECQTGAEAGRVVLTGSANLFYIKKSEKRAGLVATFEEAKVTCGAAIEKARGTLVIPVTPVGKKTTQPVLTLTRNGEAYENTYTTYENESGEVITTKFELNFGTGFKKGLLETGELHLTANKALVVGA